MAGRVFGGTAEEEVAGGVAGVLCCCACRAGAARSEAAKDNHNDGANVFILMILRDPTAFVRDGLELFSPARLKVLMRTVPGRSLPNVRDDFTRV